MEVTLGTFHATEQMWDNIEQVMETGRISYGPFSKQLEKDFSHLHGCKYGVLSNSGTSSLQVALQAMKEYYGWRDGAEVIVPATTFISTANIVRHCRLKPVFCDVEPVRFGINTSHMNRLINENTVCIIPVHMFGQPCNMVMVKYLTEGSDIKILEDSCETMFATNSEQPVGSMGDVGCFSMYVAHLLVAGVGGIATTNNPDLAMRMRSLVNHGMSLDQLNMDENFSPMPAVGRRFKFESLGHSFRITEFEAAIALAQLSTWKEMIRRRRINAQHLTARLFDLQDVITPVISGENTHSWMMYPILLRQYTNGATQSKTEIMAYLNAHGIQTRDMPSCLGQPIYPELVPEDFPMSNWINHSGFYVGCHQDLTIEHMDFVANRIKEFYGRG